MVAFHVLFPYSLCVETTQCAGAGCVVDGHSAGIGGSAERSCAYLVLCCKVVYSCLGMYVCMYVHVYMYVCHMQWLGGSNAWHVVLKCVCVCAYVHAVVRGLTIGV